MHFPHTLFKAAGLNATDVAGLVGVSRITGHRWLKGTDRNGNEGVGVNLFLRGRVSKLAADLARAVEAGALPNDDVFSLPPTKRVKKVRSIINQYRSHK